MRMKIKYFIYITIAAFLAACSEDEQFDNGYQGNLIGKGVDFQTSIAEPFSTRTTYRHDGSFNEGDLMTIYRQYSNDAGLTFDTSAGSLTYRVYQFDTKYATGTSIALETDWKPKAGAIGCTNGTTFTQTDADSLTWENGKTVRFRAWSRSNLSGTLNSTNKNSYYPDYCVSGWVTVSGPTLDVPMTLKHQGCRIGFIQKSGNVLYKAEICTEAEDYMWEDNSTVEEADAADKWADAADKAAAVKAVYDKMCMPAGVDIETSLLKGMTKAKYTSTSDFRTIHAETDGIVTFGTKTADEIASDVQRPLFTSNFDNRVYMVTIPYDISTASTQGETLTLPPYTRFRIYIFDVNDGDRAQTDDYEAKYHIFSLSDIKKSSTSTEALFPDGLELLAGYSYLFTVGYHYDKLTITPADSFSWELQNAEAHTGTDATQAKGSSDDYAWWKSAIKTAIPTSTSESYNPEFHISTAEQFLELIKLVNGTAVRDNAKNGKLTQVIDPTKTYSTESPATKSDYRWYSTDYIDSKGKVVKEHRADSTTHTQAEADGYIFYEHYHPANADQAAYSVEDYLRGPYSFFDEDLNRHFMIYLDNDLDLYDWELTTIGDDAANPFRGLVDGQGYTIKNIYMNGGYMFGTCYDVSIMNLNIETTHDFKLINTSEAANAITGYGADFVGISIKAPCSGHPFANSVTGSSYMVGCFYEGNAGGAMIGSADNLYMYGNMVAATGLDATTGALLGAYASGSSAFLAPQKSLTWGRFMVNYYDISLSPGVTAVGGVADNYALPQQYIRGAESHILKAKNDNILSDDVSYDLLTSDLMRRGYYGLAPWKAMNYAIYKYNSTTVGSVSPCNVHFVANTTGYDNNYPQLVSGAPNSTDDTTGYKDNYESLNVLKQNN